MIIAVREVGLLVKMLLVFHRVATPRFLIVAI